MMRFLSKYKYVILICLAIFPLVLNFVVGSQICPALKIAGNQNSWIAFWGAYAGAIGTVVMAIIAAETLKKNDEQLEIIKQQNRPHLFSSIFILHDWNMVSKCNEESYILRVENHGSQIAKNITIKMEVSDSSLLNDTDFKNHIDSIQQASFSLPAKGEKSFYICRALPISPQDSSKVQKDGYSKQSEFIDRVKNCTFSVALKCDGYEIENETINLNNVGYLPTSTVQMLAQINHSITELSKRLDNKP